MQIAKGDEVQQEQLTHSHPNQLINPLPDRKAGTPKEVKLKRDLGQNLDLAIHNQSCMVVRYTKQFYTGLKVAPEPPAPVEAVVDMVLGVVLATLRPILLFLKDHFGFREVMNG